MSAHVAHILADVGPMLAQACPYLSLMLTHRQTQPQSSRPKKRWLLLSLSSSSSPSSSSSTSSSASASSSSSSSSSSLLLLLLSLSSLFLLLLLLLLLLLSSSSLLLLLSWSSCFFCCCYCCCCWPMLADVGPIWAQVCPCRGPRLLLLWLLLLWLSLSSLFFVVVAVVVVDPVQNIPWHSPAKPQDSDEPFFHPVGRAALSAQCKAVARAALTPAYHHLTETWSVAVRKKALSAWSDNHVELSANDRHRAHLTPRQVYHEI